LLRGGIGLVNCGIANTIFGKPSINGCLVADETNDDVGMILSECVDELVLSVVLDR